MQPLLDDLYHIRDVVIQPYRVPHIVDYHCSFILRLAAGLEVETGKGVHQLIAPRLDQQVGSFEH